MTDTYVILDLEMPNSYAGKISAIGIAVMKNGTITDSFYSLINPECKFEDYTVKLTGISPENVADAPTFAQIWDTVKGYLEQGTLVAHAAESDLYVLSRCLAYYSITWQPTVKYLCTMRACKDVFPDIGHYGLEYLSRNLMIPLNHHHADSDALASAMLLQKCIENGYHPEEHLRVYDLFNSHRRKQQCEYKSTVKIREHLQSMKSENTRTKQISLLPGVDPKSIIGVPVPLIRHYAIQLSKTAATAQFIKCLPHTYYEENLLHAFLINYKRHYEMCLAELNRFLPYITESSVVAILHPRCFSKMGKALLIPINEWLNGETDAQKVFAVNMLTEHFTGTLFGKDVFMLASQADFSSTAVRHACVNFFSQALIQHFDEALPLLGTLKNRYSVLSSVKTKALRSSCLTLAQKKQLCEYS